MGNNELTTSAHKTEEVNRTQTMRFYPFVFTGKERDEETGYGYFGARYMDHELMTMWLSVDPMADKYPSISPYAYCAWNPVRLVDPDGREINPVFSSGGEYRGNTKEGYTGSIIIYDGTKPFEGMTADQLFESTRDDTEKAEDYTYSNYRKTMTKNAKSKMYTHIVSQLEGYLIRGARTAFSINYLKGKKVSYKKTTELSLDGAYISNKKNNSITATESNLIPLEASSGSFYEATVENIQASVVIHEWYGHLLRKWGNANGTHHYCYSAIINDPLFSKTTENYQRFVHNMYKKLKP